MNDGSSISSYGQSEATSDDESGSPTRRTSFAPRFTDVKVSGSGSNTGDVALDSEDDKRPARPRRCATAEEELSRLRSGRRLKIHRYLGDGYRDVFNSMTSEKDDGSGVEFEPQTSSQIGASFWNGHEKEAFFKALVSNGPGNVAAIAKRIGSKSESEVQYYIMLLGDHAGCLTHAEPYMVSTHIPAAREISGDCEEILDVAAGVLAGHLHKQDAIAERVESGDKWLIDERIADGIEQQYNALQQDHWTTNIIRKAVRSPDTDDITHPSSNAADPILGPTNLASQGEKESLSSSDKLLCSKSFLQLSRNLFMNHGVDDELNWQSLSSIDSAADAPALFRSAFEDLYTLAVSLTRRLVQTSLFQATSRLRAEDRMRSAGDNPPAAKVRGMDVRTAVNVLGLTTDWQSYWVKVARRCQVKVFSRAAAYADGRPSTTLGGCLTYDEVEDALCHRDGELLARFDETEPTPMHDVEVWDAINDEALDILTETDNDDASSSESTNGSGDDDAMKPRYSAPRKRAFDEGHNQREQTRYLDALDRKADLEEEHRLWKVLRLQPPAVVPDERSYGELSAPPKTVKCGAGRVEDWRDRLEYEAEWELPQHLIGPQAFREMDLRGQMGRKRRKLLYDRIEQRLNAKSTNGDGHEAESQDADEDEDREDDEEQSQIESKGHDGEGADDASDSSVSDSDIDPAMLTV